MFAYLIHFGDFVDAPLVPSAGKLRVQKFLHDRDGLVLAHDFAASAITLASLCSRARRAVSESCASAARMPSTLLAAMETPMPVPQTRTPSSIVPGSTRSPTARAKSG